ncbi:MAG: D-alanyl-D-alanine carboxypeptidase [Actinomycetota bacterium]|nr:D-alanyl-D-alanine carboxypeptidase [Actinomycetota bacterium]
MHHASRAQFRRALLVILTALLVSAAGLSAPSQALQIPTEAQTSAESRINNRISQRFHNKAIGKEISLVVMDAQSQRIIASRKADTPMLPASNMKIVTAVNVLSTMAPTQTFTTSVFSGSQPGHITLQGGADPLLTARNLRALAAQTAVLVDPTQPLTVDTDVNLLPKASKAPGWTNGYMPYVVAPVSALAKLGDYSRTPVVHARDTFIDELRSRGLNVTAGSEADVPAGSAPLTSISPNSVAEAVHLMLLDSENNVAELLFRHVAIATGHPSTWAGAEQAALANLDALGIDRSAATIVDGSGVSRKDRLTALSLAAILRLASTTDPARFSVMFDPGSLPTSGVDGTLDDRLHRYSSKPSACARGAIRAKTGTLFDTIALSGITQDADGRAKIFSFMVNDRPQRVTPLKTRQAVDGLAATVTGCW